MASKTPPRILHVAGRDVRISSPDKPYFPSAGVSKLQLVEYYLGVGDGALRGVAGRPLVMKRYVDGAEGPFFFQKRAPKSRPPWIDTVTLRYASGRSADEVVVHDAAQLAWLVNLGCLDLNPHPVRATDLKHPDELRIDLDPVPGVEWDQVRRVALTAGEVLAEHGLSSWPKTSGSRGFHLLVRLQPRWAFEDVRRAALAVAREVERRMPGEATSLWWKEHRHGVFLDYNQNAPDRTTASAYSVRPTPDARVSAPLRWDEVHACDPADFTVHTVPRRFAAIGDPHAGIDDDPGDLTSLLDLVAQHEAEGLGDEPLPDLPVIVIGQSEDKDAALAGLERWKARHPQVVAHLEPRHVLVDGMRGRFTLWWRVRVNLEAVPAKLRPDQGPLDPDDPPRWGPPRGAAGG